MFKNIFDTITKSVDAYKEWGIGAAFLVLLLYLAKSTFQSIRPPKKTPAVRGLPKGDSGLFNEAAGSVIRDKLKQVEQRQNQLKSLIKNHELTLIENGITTEPYSPKEKLYESMSECFMTITDFDIPFNGEKAIIGVAKKFDNLSQVKKAQEQSKLSKNNFGKSVHFYQELYDTYGKNFPNKVDDLISKLPKLINIDSAKFDYSYKSVQLINESFIGTIVMMSFMVISFILH